MKERRTIAPVKPVCLEGPLCFTSTAHGPSYSSKELLLSSLLPLSPTFSGSPLNLMVPSSSSASRPCDSWRASVLYYTTLPQGVRTPLSSDLCFCHTHTHKHTGLACTHRPAGTETHPHTHSAIPHCMRQTSHTFTPVSWRCHIRTRHTWSSYTGMHTEHEGDALGAHTRSSLTVTTHELSHTPGVVRQ